MTKKRKSSSKKLNLASSEGLGVLKDRFLDALKAKGSSPTTIELRSFSLQYFCKWCEQRSIDDPIEITKENIQNYQKHITKKTSKNGKPITINTQNVYLISLIVFFRWLTKNDYILTSPAKDLSLIQADELPKEVLDIEQVETILNSIDISTAFGIRDRAILETFYSTGIRRAELANLNLGDIDLERGTLFIREGKGSKDRLVPIGERAIRWIEKYIQQARPNFLKDINEQTLFLTRCGGKFLLCSLSARMKNYVKKVSDQGSCHIFRHTAATLMLENGAKIRHIQSFLGHDCISSTKIYTKVAIKQLKEVHQKSHPACSRNKKIAEIQLQRKVGLKQASTKKERKIRYFEPEPENELKTLANKYLQWMEASSFAFETIRKRREYLGHFIDWCAGENTFTAIAITKKFLQRYQIHMLSLLNPKTQRPYCAGYRQRFSISICVFFRWLQENSFILFNPAESLEIPKNPRRIPRDILTEQEVDKVLSMPQTTKAGEVRNRAILETLYACALRVQELVNININDVSFSKETLFVKQGKGKKDRVVPISQNALNWIETYLQQIRPLFAPKENEEALFITVKGERISPITVNGFIKRYLKAAEITKTGGCHLFRHSSATHMLEHGADLRYIQSFLGHSSLETTTIYTKVAIHKLKEVHTKTHPARMHTSKMQQALKELE